MDWTNIIPLAVSAVTAIYIGYEKWRTAKLNDKLGDGQLFNTTAQTLLKGYEDQLRSVHLSYAERVKDLGAEIDRLETRVHELETQLVQAEKDRRVLEEQVQDLVAEILRLTQQKNVLEQELIRLKKSPSDTQKL